MDDKLHNRDAEEYVVGSLMVDPVYIPSVTDRVISIIGTDPTAFFTADNQLIYRAVLDLRHSDKPTTTIAVCHELKSNNNLNRAGGEERLYALQASVVETENTPYYSELVKDLHIRRQMVFNLMRQVEMAQDENVGITSITQASIEDAKQADRQMSLDRATMISAQEVKSTSYPETPDLVDGLFRQGMILLAGQPKVGKSYAMLNLAVAVCNKGGKVWGHYPVSEPVNTIYVAMESSYNELQERFQQIGPGESMPDNLFFMEMEEGYGFRLDAKGLKTLEIEVVEREIGLVIIDTWERASQIMEGKGNAYQNEHKYLEDVYNWAKRLQISIVLVHHTRKSKDEL